MSLVAYESSGDESQSEEEVKSIKKPKETVKIRIPSLKEFEDSEDKPVPKKPKLQKGHGLFSLLPPPRNTSSFSKTGFVPHIISSKKEQPSVTSAVSKRKSMNPEVRPVSSAETQKSENENTCEQDNLSEESSKVTASNDFFWLDDLASSSKANNENNASFLEPQKSNSTQNATFQLPSSSTSNVLQSDVRSHYNFDKNADSYLQSYPEQLETDAPEIEENSEANIAYEQQPFSYENFVTESVDDPKEALLKDKEFLKLQGKRRDFEAINIIDVKADDHLADKNEWLMKSITEETAVRPKRKHNMPTQQQKRKHQITFLAFQAKEREMDLKNQWALNNRTRRETQAKYGF